MKRYIFNLFLLLAVSVFFSIDSQAQQKITTVQFQGKILDETGHPIPSAKIHFDNGNKIAITSADGSYSIDMAMADIVLVEAPDFETVRLTGEALSNKSDISLQKKPYGLKSGDLVNVPFGTLYSRQLSGAVTVIKVRETMKSDKSENAASVLNGRVPGLFGNLNTRSNTDLYNGALNESGNSITVIDGVPRTGYNLNLSEIETVTVLKDITSKALYGAQALDGVILITTRRGEANKREMNLSVERGISNPVSFPKFLNAADYMTFYNQALLNDGRPGKYSADAISLTRNGADKLKYPEEDYYNSTYLKSLGSFTNVIGEASGGNSNAQYYLNMGWKNSTGLMKKLWDENFTDGTNTFNVRGNVDYRINNFIKMKVDGVVFYETNSTPRFNGTNQNFYTRASSFLPNYYPVLIDTSLLSIDQRSAAKLIDGKYVLGGTSEYQTNIYGEMALNGYSTSITRILQNNTGLDFDLDNLMKGLTAKAYLTFDLKNYYSKSLARTYAIYQPVYTPVAGAETLNFIKYGVDVPANKPQISNEGFSRRISLTGQLNYLREFDGRHKVNVTGISYTDYLAYSGTLQNDKTVTFGLRSNYMFKDKYIAEINLVTSGSAKFSKNKWGTSPSLGLGWIVTEEGFLKNNSIINYLKLHANAGTLKTDLYSAYRQDMNYYASSTVYNYGFGAWSNNSMTVNSGNPNITWAEKKEASVGFESVVLSDKFQIEAAYFSNSLSGIPLKLSNIYPGFVEQAWENYGEYTSKGVEWGVKYNVKLGRAMLTIGHNAVYSLPKRVKADVLDYAEPWRKRAGSATDAIFGLEADGFYATGDFNPNGSLKSGIPLPGFGEVRPGDIKYIDINKDGFVNSKDEKVIGNSSSRLQYGLTINLKAGDFELFALGTGQTGAEAIYSSSYYWVYGDRKYSEVVRNSWTEATASTADYPRLSANNNPNNFQNSTFWMKKNNFFTLHTAQLTYNLPVNMAGKIAMKSMQFFVRGTNLLTISDNKERRELNTASQPQMRNFSVGVTANF